MWVRSEKNGSIFEGKRPSGWESGGGSFTYELVDVILAELVANELVRHLVFRVLCVRVALLLVPSFVVGARAYPAF